MAILPSKKILKRILGDPQAGTLKRMKKRVNEVNALSDSYNKLSDAKLRAKTDDFKKRLADGKSLDQLLPEAST